MSRTIGQFHDHCRQLLSQVDFNDYTFLVATNLDDGTIYLQAHYSEADVYSGQSEVQRTRKWLLSTHMTDSEIVQTAFKCCLTSMEHRTREGFTYKGARIFGPHFDVEDLVGLCRDGREAAGGRAARDGVAAC